MATDTTTASDTARAVFDACSAHDPERTATLWAEDVSERFPDGSAPERGMKAALDAGTALKARLGRR